MVRLRYDRVADLSRLINAGATPWAKVDKPCALFLSMALGHRECVELLLPLTPLSAIDTALTQTGETCLSIAIRKREPSWVKALLECGAAVDAPGPEGQSPLFQALHHWLPRLQTQKALQTQNMALELQGRLPRVVRQQISPFPEERGDFVFNALFSDPGMKSGIGEMMHSDLSPDVSAKSIVELLLEHAADAEAGDVDGVTPLMLAAQYGARWPMQELLYNGASPRCRDRQRRTVVTMLHQHGHEEMVGWFLSLLSQGDRQWFV